MLTELDRASEAVCAREVGPIHDMAFCGAAHEFGEGVDCHEGGKDFGARRGEGEGGW